MSVDSVLVKLAVPVGVGKAGEAQGLGLGVKTLGVKTPGVKMVIHLTGCNN